MTQYSACGGMDPDARNAIIYLERYFSVACSVHITEIMLFKFSLLQSMQKGTLLGAFFALVAEVGFEPHDLRVMSPTSYQAALLRDI